MSAALKLRIATNLASEDLWRVAETDDVNELMRILTRDVDVNARNRHGMTALMRAAYHGNAEMVRVLLEHGADPNIARNDRFTALALAAFFGHTETVRILIEHGAKTEVVTRCGTSAYMWATARTFAEAARCLDSKKRKPVAAPVPVAPTPVARAAAPAPAPAPAQVKTLKDPPEIWDLVHEVPRGFDPRTAFVSRLRSIHRGVAVCVLAGLLLIVAGGVGVLLLRGSQARVVIREAHLNPTPATNVVPVPAPVENESVQASAAAPVAETNEPPVVSSHQRRVQFKARSSEPSFVAPVIVDDQPIILEPEKPATVAVPQFEKPKSKPVEGLSPQVLTSPQNAKPKAKVIQWP